MIFHAFLIKYAEIAIKGKNRYLFEDALVKQMNIALSKIEGDYRVVKEQGRVYVFCPEECSCIKNSIRYCLYLSGSDLRGQRI